MQHGRVNIWALSRISYLSGNVKSRFPIYRSEIHHQVHYFSHLAPICATFKEPMGFGPAPKKRKKSKMRRDYEEEDDDEEQEEEEEPDRGVIPEVVTNRMMRRMAVSVGIPLGIGLFFPHFSTISRLG